MLVSGLPTSDTDRLLEGARSGSFGGPSGGGAVPPGMPSLGPVTAAPGEDPFFVGNLFGAATESIRRSLARVQSQPGPPEDFMVFVGGPRDRRIMDTRAQGDDFLRSNETVDIPNDRRVKSGSALMNDFYDMSPKKRGRLAQKLWLAGLVSNAAGGLQDANLEDIVNAYQKLLQFSADRFANGKLITPNEALNDFISFRFPDQKGSVAELYSKVVQSGSGIGGTGAPQGPITTFSKNRVVDLTSPAEAKQFMRAAMQQLLGRDPTQEEFEDFVTMLNEREQDNPLIERTKTTQRPNGSGSSLSTVRQAGEVISRARTTVDRQGNETTNVRQVGEASPIDAAAMAEREVRSAPNFAEFQAAGTYFPALMELLGPVA